jgi:putative oxidoreductase
MKIAVIIVRVLIGLLFVFASVTYFLNLIPTPEFKGNVKVFNDGIAASVYLMPLVKTIELLCGIAFVSGFFVPLALVLIAPIAVNILLFHVFLDRTGLPVVIPLFLGLLFLAYTNRKSYEPLFVAK